jgi:hypothetical protein
MENHALLTISRSIRSSEVVEELFNKTVALLAGQFQIHVVDLGCSALNLASVPLHNLH